MRLQSRTILVTGGSSGIGAQLVRQLHRKGNRLLVVGRDPERLRSLEAAVPGVLTYGVDLADRDAVDVLCRQIGNEHPDLSVVFNNAAVQVLPEFRSDGFSLAEVEREVSINLLAPVRITALLWPVLLAQPEGAAVVNVGSGLGQFPKRSSAVYCATKAGLRSLTQSLNYQFEGTDLRFVEAVLPMVDTPMTTGRGRGKMDAAAAARAIIAGVEAGRREVYVGKARLLPVLARIAPGVARAILRRG